MQHDQTVYVRVVELHCWEFLLLCQHYILLILRCNQSNISVIIAEVVVLTSWSNKRRRSKKRKGEIPSRNVDEVFIFQFHSPGSTATLCNM